MLNKTKVEQTPPAKGRAIDRTTLSKNSRLRSSHDFQIVPKSRCSSRRCRSREASTRNDVLSCAGGSLTERLRRDSPRDSEFRRLPGWNLIRHPPLSGSRQDSHCPDSDVPSSAAEALPFPVVFAISPCPERSPEYRRSLRNSNLLFPSARVPPDNAD